MWWWFASALAGPVSSAPSWEAASGPWGDAVVHELRADPDGLRALTDAGLYVGDARIEAFTPRPGAEQRLFEDGVLWALDGQLCGWMPGAEPACLTSQQVPTPRDDGWAAGLRGVLYRFDREQGWVSQTTPLPDVLESHVDALEVVDGAVWLVPSHGPVRVGGPGAWRELERPSTEVDAQRFPARLCEGGLWVQDGVWQRDGQRWVERLPVGSRATSCGDGLVGSEDGRVWSVDDAVIEWPTSFSGRVAGVGEVGWVGSKRIVPGTEATAFREVAADWGLADAGPSLRAWFVHADADGREDVLLLQSGGQLRVLRHDGERFVDGTLDSGLAAERWNQPELARCDLDRDGLEDLVVWDGQGLRWFRGTGRGWEDVSDRGLDHRVTDAPVHEILCEDLDGDGDRDLLLVHGIARDDARPWPDDVHENTGWGRLRRVPPALRGLSLGAVWNFGAGFEDLDGDGAKELIQSNAWVFGIVVRTRNDAGLWEPAPALDTTYGLFLDQAAADFDGDGRTDLVQIQDDAVRFLLARDPDWQVATSPPDALGRLASPWTFAPPGHAVDDVDGDGRSDLLVPVTDGVVWHRVVDGEVERVRGAGLDLGGEVRHLAASDIDGDGDLDLLLPSSRGPDRLLLNTRSARGGPAASPPVATVGGGGAWLGRRLAWLRWGETGGRLGVVWAALVAVGSWGRRRDTVAFGRLWVVGVLALVAVGVELVLGEAPTWVRWVGGLVGVGLVAGLSRLDLAVTRSVRATRIAGYRLEGSLGSGGMGTVHLARDGSRQVALKLLHPELAEDPDACARFRREAELAARFSHPHLVAVHEAGECRVFRGDRPERTLYLAMEYVDGRSLRSCLGEPVPMGQACRLLVDLLDALAVLHEGGVVHRDIKPENLLLRRDGCLKLADFGVAQGQASQALTRSGHVLGTLTYMAPEQARGKPTDERADLYAVGVLAYELIRGERPFQSDEGVDLVYQLLTTEPDRLDEAPDAVADAVQACLSKRPEDRPPTARALQDVLAAFADEAVVTSVWLGLSERRSTPPVPSPLLETTTRA